MTWFELFQFCLSVTLMALTVMVPARVVLKVPKWPVVQALTIAFVSNAFGKISVSFLSWPPASSYSLPTLAFLLLSRLFFQPSIVHLIAYWLCGFAMYLVIHVLLSLSLGWNFMFPFWILRR